jgi:hypothetical protein
MAAYMHLILSVERLFDATPTDVQISPAPREFRDYLMNVMGSSMTSISMERIKDPGENPDSIS